jgi:alkylation response protein AidB-like acyl-CoA dehydrogenase
MIAATTADDRIVLALLPAQDRPGLRAGPSLRLSVMGGTHTVALTIDDLAIGADDVLAVHDGPAWRVADAQRTANATPASLGLLRRIVVALAALGEERDRPEAVHAAFHLGGHGAALREQAYALLRDVPAAERLPERTALRGELAALTVRAAHALVAARSGSGLLADSPEQRWAREAAFHMVQAQTAAVRAAQLTALVR